MPTSDIQPITVRATLIAGLAILYYLCGKLSLFLAIPPGYASIVWPAAGVALAAVLLFGARCWWGIFLGSFLVNLGTDFSATDLTTLLHSILLPAALACGATLQAVFGATLIRRLIGFPLAFNQIHQVGKAFLLGGPLSCLIGATLGVCSLFVAGTLSADSFAANWLTWWIGDQLGVLIVLPLVLGWNRNLALFRSRTLLTVVLPLVIALLLVIGLFFQIRANEITRERLRFVHHSNRLVSSFKDALHAHLDDLYAIEGLYRSSREVSRQEFSSFVSSLSSRHPGVQALEWVPRVAHRERSAYEARARRDGFIDFQVRERTEDRQLITATEREEYFPVYFLEPYQGNESVLGFDLGSNELRLAAMEQARDLAGPVASSRIQLIQEKADQFGMLVFLPIYTGRSVPNLIEERRQALHGYALGVFRVRDMLQASMADEDSWGVTYALHDRSAPPSDQLLFGSDESSLSPVKNTMRFSDQLKNSVSFEFATRRWELSFSPSPQYLGGLRFVESRAMLVGGLLFAGLLGNVLLVAAGRNVAVRNLVAERTASLAEANEALQISAEQQRAIVDNAVDGIATIDEQGRILTFNAAAQRLFGYRADEVIGQNVNRLQPEPYHSEHDGYLQRYLHSGVPHVIGIGREVSGRRKDGEVFPLELSVGEIRLNDRRQFIGILRDITERKQAEEAMHEANEKLKQVDRLKSMFIASMSHELRTPLNAIIGFTSILHEEWLGALNHEQKENLAIVTRSGKHLLALINDVIDISKIEGDQLDVHKETFDLYQVIEEAVNTVKAQAEVHKLELRIENRRYELHTDRLRLLQCLLNLLSNAIKYTQQGWIGITVTVLDEDSRDNARLRISVTDTGIGISAEDQAALFTPFVRFDSVLKSRIPGTGLGLYLSRKLVCDVLQGTLTCTSLPGQGSCFELTVPVSLEGV